MIAAGSRSHNQVKLLFPDNRKIILSAEALYPFVIPAQAGIQASLNWTPACAGVTIIL
jgi:hypothetical protein